MMRPRLIFVHGIGQPRPEAKELGLWSRALATGVRRAGHSRLAAELELDPPPEVRFVHYADLFAPPQAQGGPGLDLDEQEAAILADLFLTLIDARLADGPDERDRRILAHARAQVAPQGQAQGTGNVIRQVVNAATTLLSLSPLRRGGEWLVPRLMAGDLAQVARYLARGEADGAGITLDQRIRGRLADALDATPAVVVAHSLGSVVAFETLHDCSTAVPLFVTLGSPLAMRTVVWPRLAPQPPRTPEPVGCWLNFWDRDDFVTARPDLAADILPSRSGITVESRRVDSDGLWVHPAVTYLATPGVGGPIAEALTAPAGLGPR